MLETVGLGTVLGKAGGTDPAVMLEPGAERKGADTPEEPGMGFVLLFSGVLSQGSSLSCLSSSRKQGLPTLDLGSDSGGMKSRALGAVSEEGLSG